MLDAQIKPRPDDEARLSTMSTFYTAKIPDTLEEDDFKFHVVLQTL